MRRNTLNNMILENIRKSQAYQAILTDLAIEEVIPVDVAERLLGYEIPGYLHSPQGKSIRRAPLAQAREDAPPETKSRKKSE